MHKRVPASGVTAALARFVVGTRWDDLPAPVIHAAKRSLTNFFAVALAGCRDATFETALASLAAFSGGRQAALLGRRERIDVLSAAFLNAAGGETYKLSQAAARGSDANPMSDAILNKSFATRRRAPFRVSTSRR